MKPLLATIILLIHFNINAQDIQDLVYVNSQSDSAEIQFEIEVYDFGEIIQGEKVQYVYKFKNIGEVPLKIVSGQGSCGCTVPYYPTIPILKGEQSEIQVEFDSNGKIGTQYKTITIVANTTPAVHILVIKGTVVAKEDTDLDNMLNQNHEADKAKIESIDSECFVIYPNPTNDVLKLELKESIGKSATIEIFDRIGNSMLVNKIDKISYETTTFNVSQFKPGIYTVTIFIAQDNKYLTQCFVVN